jgi:hypothetical protein
MRLFVMVLDFDVVLLSIILTSIVSEGKMLIKNDVNIGSDTFLLGGDLIQTSVIGFDAGLSLLYLLLAHFPHVPHFPKRCLQSCMVSFDITACSFKGIIIT